jgi:hypothetical protein
LFESEKPASVVKKHPDLAPNYGYIDVGIKFAEANLPEACGKNSSGLQDGKFCKKNNSR